MTPNIEVHTFKTESEYARLTLAAEHALIELRDFWTSLYGPNEALGAAFEALEALDETWNET